MSKLYDNYLFLKANEKEFKNTLYLFKSGIFFIMLADDAVVASRLLNLKTTIFVNDIIKCGFPINSLDKYSSILSQSNYKFKIIDTSKSTCYTLNNYTIDKQVNNLLYTIIDLDEESLSISEAYSFISQLKIHAQNILNNQNNEKEQ